MKKKVKKSTGVSITEKFLRIAEIEANEGTATILRLYEFPLPDISNPREVKEFKNSVKKVKIRLAGCVSPSDKDIILKDKILPPVKKQEIFKLIESEVKDYAIFNHENVSLGFNITEKALDKITIIWVGLKESLLMKFLHFLRNIGITSKAVIPSNFAIVRFIVRFYETSNNFVVMNIDNSVTSLTFVKDGKVVLNYKHDLGFQDVVSGGEEMRNNWVGNVLTTITFVSRNRKIPIDKVFLVSQQGNPEKLLPFLTARMSYPVIIPDLKTLVGFKNEEDFLRVQKTGGVEFIVPIGLALLCQNGLQDPLFCDISKHILVEKASVRLKIVAISILLIVVNGVAIYFYPLLASMLKNLSANLSNTEKRIEIVSKEAENTEKIKKELSDAKDTLDRYKSIESALKNRVITSMLISELKEKLPQGVEIINVSIDGNGNISVSGFGKSFKNVLDYEINLSSAKFVEDASVYDMAKGGSGIVVFKMSARVKGALNEKK